MNEQVMKEKPQCPKCYSHRVWKQGFRPSSKYGQRQRWQCGECGKTFYVQ